MNKTIFESDGAARIGKCLARACRNLNIPSEAAHKIFHNSIVELALHDINACGKYDENRKEDYEKVKTLLGEYIDEAYEELKALNAEPSSTRH
jgi:hypothetical protein